MFKIYYFTKYEVMTKYIYEYIPVRARKQGTP